MLDCRSCTSSRFRAFKRSVLCFRTCPKRLLDNHGVWHKSFMHTWEEPLRGVNQNIQKVLCVWTGKILDLNNPTQLTSAGAATEDSDNVLKMLQADSYHDLYIPSTREDTRIRPHLFIVIHTFTHFQASPCPDVADTADNPNLWKVFSTLWTDLTARSVLSSGTSVV